MRCGVEATNFTVSPNAGGLRELARMVDAGELVVGLRKAFPLWKASAALEESRAGRTLGRMVLTVG